MSAHAESESEEGYVEVKSEESEENSATSVRGLTGIDPTVTSAAGWGSVGWTSAAGGVYTTTSPITTGVSTSAKSTPDDVSLPPKVTRKVLVAFLDPTEEDETKNLVWARVLSLKNIDINPSVDLMGESTMTVELSLKDFYGNEDSTD